MKEPSIHIRNGLLFPVQFQILGYSLLFFGLVLLIINIWVSIIFMLLGLLIVTAFAGIEFKNKHYREYNAFYFIKSGNWKSFDSIEKIFIKKFKRSQRLYGRANQSSIIKSYIYKAFLKFGDGETVLLYKNKNKSKLDKKILALTTNLKTEVTDYTNP